MQRNDAQSLNQQASEYIKKGMKKEAMKYHPDKNSSPESAERFKYINKAHEVLSDQDAK